MRSKHRTQKIAWAMVLTAAATMILAAPAHAQGRGRAARHNPAHPTGRPPVPDAGVFELGVVAPGYGWGWWNYPYDGTAYTPYGAIQYTQYGYGWGLPYYFIPFSDGSSYGW